MLLVTMSIFSFLSVGGYAGTFGAWFSMFLSRAFGFTKIFFPFALLCVAAVLFKEEKEKDTPHPWIQGCAFIFFILCFTAFWHLHYHVEEAFQEALKGNGGGVSGFFLSAALQQVVGFWGALLVLIAIFISTSLILFNTSLGTLLQYCQEIPRVCVSSIRKCIVAYQVKRSRKQKESMNSDTDHTPDDIPSPSFSKKIFTTEDSKEGNEGQPSLRGDDQNDMEVLKPSKRKTTIQLSLDLLRNVLYQPTSGDIKANKLIIEKTLENFGIPVEMGEVNVGPTVTQFTLKPAEGIKLASITALQNDLSLALAAHPLRIEAPIPGRALVGIEVPNQKVALVTVREILESSEFKSRKNNLSIILGKDVSGRARIASLASMPHLLIAGSTGSGKTVCINTIIISLLFQNTPESLRFIMVDPKRVELPLYNDIPHLLTPVITDVKKTLNALRWTIKEMERRFDILSTAGKRDIASYNTLTDEKLPYIVIVIDELAEIMLTVGVEAESLIILLAQKARAVGIHLILATQRPSVDVITGLIKANITSRIAFAVASQMDSRTILDTGGAEKLIGRGDMLYVSAELSKPVRIQGAYLVDEEIDRVVKRLKEHGEPTYETAIVEKSSGGLAGSGGFGDDEDELLSRAKEVIIQAKKASASLLQRRLRVGYARAARLLDLLEAQGIIGPADGARPRDVLIGNLEELDIHTGNFKEDDEETSTNSNLL